METATAKPKIVNHGKNIRRCRGALSIPQKALAELFDMTQQAYSEWERKPVIEQDKLEKIAEYMSIPLKFLTEMEDDDSAITNNIFQNTFQPKSAAVMYYCIFQDSEQLLHVNKELLETLKEFAKNQNTVK